MEKFTAKQLKELLKEIPDDIELFLDIGEYYLERISGAELIYQKDNPEYELVDNHFNKEQFEDEIIPEVIASDQEDFLEGFKLSLKLFTKLFE